MTAWTLVGRVVTERSGQIKELFRLVEDKGFVYLNGIGGEDRGKNQDAFRVFRVFSLDKWVWCVY